LILTPSRFLCLFASLAFPFRTRVALQVDNLALRYQVGVLQRSVKRPKLTTANRLLWAWLSVVWPEWRSALVKVTPFQIPSC
jgi:putative transposase